MKASQCLFFSLKLQLQRLSCPDNLTKFVPGLVFFIQLGSVTTASGGGGGVGVFAGMSDWHLGRHSSDSFGIARHTWLRGARQPEYVQHPRHPARRTNQPGLLSSSFYSCCWGTSLLNSSHLTAVLRWQGGWNYHCLLFFVAPFWSHWEGGSLYPSHLLGCSPETLR